MRRLTIGIILSLVLFMLFVVLCTYVRRPYEQILLVRFGKIKGADQQIRLMYNWYLKLPTDTVVRIDTRLHLFPGTLQEVTTKGKEVISIQTFAAWQIVDPQLFYKRINADDDKAKSIMSAKVTGLVASELGKHTLDELFNIDETKIHTDEIERTVANGVSETSIDGTPGLKDLGIEVTDVGFSRMAFAPQNAPQVYLRMVEELKRQAISFDTEGLAEATRIKAEGKAAADQTRNLAKAQVGEMMGKADQTAMGLYAAVQNSPEDKDFFQFWKALEFLKSSLTKNTILVLSSDSDLLKVLMNSPLKNWISPAPRAATQPAATAPAGGQRVPGPGN